MKDQSGCKKIPNTSWEDGGKSHLGLHDLGEKSGSKWRGFNLVQKVFGLCAAKTGTKIDDSMQAKRKWIRKSMGQC